MRAPAPKWMVVGKGKAVDASWRGRSALGRVADLHEAKLEDVVRPLRDADVGPHHPGQRAPVERNQRQVGAHQSQRVADELAAAREVGLDADRVDQLIELADSNSGRR